MAIDAAFFPRPSVQMRSPHSCPRHSLFTQNCASCHTLTAAHAKGTVGPNLDQLKPSKAVVVRQVTNGGGGMPAFGGRLSATQIDALAVYVATSAK